MRVVPYPDYDRMSAAAAARVMEAITAKPDLLLGAATGNSPTGLYEALADMRRDRPGTFAHVRVVALDEWGGVSNQDPGSCASYLTRRVLEPLGIAPERLFSWNGCAPDPPAECERMQAVLARQGPVDLCILGLGANGHLAFNEPGAALHPGCHVATLSEATRAHAMVRKMEAPPGHGFTLGMRDILASRRILLLVTGEGKRRVTAELLSGTVSTGLPASFLWLHDRAEAFIDRSTAGEHIG